MYRNLREAITYSNTYSTYRNLNKVILTLVQENIKIGARLGS